MKYSINNLLLCILALAGSGDKACAASTTKDYAIYSGLGALALGGGYAAYVGIQSYLYTKRMDTARKYLVKLRDDTRKAPDRDPFAHNVYLGPDNHQIIVAEQDEKFISQQQIKARKRQILNNPLSLLLENQGAQWRHYYGSMASPSYTRFGRIGEAHELSDDPLEAYLSGSGSGAEIAPLLNKSIWREHESNALCMLDECSEGRCCLTRSTDSTRARAQFETTVVDAVEHQAKINGGYVTFVDVGAGQLFQDLIILTKALEQSKHIKHVNVVLIDRSYKTYIENMQNSKRWQPQQFDYTESGLHNLHARIAQFTQWFTHAYPQYTMNYFVYGTIGTYIEHVQKEPQLQANIYMGSDLDKSLNIPPLRYYVEHVSTTGDSREDSSKNGHEAYLSADLSKFMKPGGIGLMLLKDDLSQAPALINHCIKLHPQEAPRPHKGILVNPDHPKLAGRFLTLEKSYSSWFGWIQNKLALYFRRQ